jgi:hypothetical protein
MFSYFSFKSGFTKIEGREKHAKKNSSKEIHSKSFFFQFFLIEIAE